MEKRLGVIAVLIQDTHHIDQMNAILSDYGHSIIGRLGVPIREKKLNIISLIVEGTTDELGALTGKIGRLPGIQVKSVLTHYREAVDQIELIGTDPRKTNPKE
ncbi:MAG: iron-only hydrogenase system regulator [Candidatus Delongbacteria bacterium]|nr:iron-only hydrogenase system regulator [Candidatus Delongbacteria bacterium]